MSDSEEKEYEVERITAARVGRGGKGRGGKKWQYRVKWKGYDSEDDTWEPEESFDSPDLLQKFWERANTGSRDKKDITLFSLGERFEPVGPPRRKRKRSPAKSEAPSESQDAMQVDEPTNSLSENKKRRASEASADDLALTRNGRASPDVDDVDVSEKASTSTPPVMSAFPRKRGRKPKVQTPETVSAPAGRLTRVLSGKKRQASFVEEVPPSDDSEVAPPPNRRRRTAQDVPQRRKNQGPGVVDSVSDNEAARSNQLSRLVKKTGKKQKEVSPEVEDVPETQQPAEVEVTDAPPTSPPDEPPPASSGPKMPSHRVKEANPRVQRIDFTDPRGGISTKSRVTSRKTNGASTPGSPSTPSRPKPGPGRSSAGLKNKSSLLTAEHGSLKTVKGRYRPDPKAQAEEKEDFDDLFDAPAGAENDAIVIDEPVKEPTPAPLPTAEELLKMAGLDAKANELEDFEEDAPEPPPKVPTEHERNVTAAKNRLLPTTPIASPSDDAGIWKRPNTIFGILGTASDVQPDVVVEPSNARVYPLALDTEVSVPVKLAELVTSGSISLETIVNGCVEKRHSCFPGKLYDTDAALSVVSTLRTGYSSAKVVVSPDANERQKALFSRFAGLLGEGKLFVALTGQELLVYCSANYHDLSRGLNIPSSLLQKDAVLASRVVIEQYGAYADAAERFEKGLKW